MTRSVTIVNTSNWADEDYDVVETDKAGNVLGRHRLKPGEQFTSFPYTRNFSFEEVQETRAAPFELNKKQVFPTVISYVGTKPKVREG